MSKPVGYIYGKLTLEIENGGTVDIGRVRLPLVETRVSPEKAPYMSFGIGVNLEEVTETVQGIFKGAENDN